MSLRQVAGPFAPSFFNIPDGNPDNAVSAPPACWIPNRGVAIFAQGIGVMSVDNTIVHVNHTQQSQTWGWDLATKQLIQLRDGLKIFRDPFGFCAKTQADGYRPLPEFMSCFADDARQRFIYRNGYMQSALLFNNQPYLTYGDPFPAWGASGVLTMGPGRTDTELFVSGVKPGYANRITAAFFDTDTRKWGPELFFSRHATCAVYAPDLGVIITVDGLTSSVWLLEAVPTHLSPVTLQQGQNARGQLATYQVSVLGDQNDPCANEVVEWSIQGPGTLLDPTGVSDENGVATCRVYYQVFDTGNSTVNVSLKC